jgi:beta-lactamase superfamily II metal-dependent hydrolase
MPHHGSRKNVYPEIMKSLKGSDTVCYISCADDDLGHHPSKRLINMLLENGFKVFATAGSTLNRGWNAPNRNWSPAKCYEQQKYMDTK